jgi:hypothetical protein
MTETLIRLANVSAGCACLALGSLGLILLIPRVWLELQGKCDFAPCAGPRTYVLLAAATALLVTGMILVVRSRTSILRIKRRQER